MPKIAQKPKTPQQIQAQQFLLFVRQKIKSQQKEAKLAFSEPG